MVAALAGVLRHIDEGLLVGLRQSLRRAYRDRAVADEGAPRLRQRHHLLHEADVALPSIERGRRNADEDVVRIAQSRGGAEALRWVVDLDLAGGPKDLLDVPADRSKARDRDAHLLHSHVENRGDSGSTAPVRQSRFFPGQATVDALGKEGSNRGSLSRRGARRGTRLKRLSRVQSILVAAGAPGKLS